MFYLFLKCVLQKQIEFQYCSNAFPDCIQPILYITAYMMVYILSPFLNKVLLELNTVQYQRLIATIITF